MREQYYEYIRENSVDGSGTAHAYVRALDLLGTAKATFAAVLCRSSSIFGFDKNSIMEYKWGV